MKSDMAMQKRIKIHIFLLTAIMLVAFCGRAAIADGDFGKAFESSKLPWYDGENDMLTSSNAPPRGDSAVSDRNRIPAFQQKKKGQQTAKPPAPPAGAAGGSAFGTIGTTIVYAVAIIFALILIGLLVYGFLQLESDGGESDESAKKKRNIKDHIKHLPFEIEEQEGDFETFAEKSMREGDYSKAVIYLFADVLVSMSDSGVVRLQRGKTNRQYLNDIWDYGEIKPYYRQVMTAFEDAFFGKHDIEKDRAEECFAGRGEFEAALEKIRQAKFAASQQQPTIPQNMQVEGATS